MFSNAEHLRAWLLGCGAIDVSQGFGLDFLDGKPGSWALFAVASEVAARENILGQVAPGARQAQVFELAYRAAVGADGAGSGEALARLEAVARWIEEQGAAGSLPEWAGGAVEGVAVATSPGAGDYGAGTARYQMRLRVTYRRG